MTDGPMSRYRDLVATGRLRDDPGQRLAVEKLQLLHRRLEGYDPRRPRRVGLALFGWGRERITASDIPGLYLFGGVGRGKSMLMDLFFEGAPVDKKRRVHFHAFMTRSCRWPMPLPKAPRCCVLMKCRSATSPMR